MATLMVQGTTSDAGKSTLVAAICRSLQRDGHSVAPFKPQNMALNSAVTSDGGEIGRAQALQAKACKIAATVDMNPILLKPASDVGAQVIVQGKVRGNMTATSFHEYKQVAINAVMESHQRLSSQFANILVEGAGSPAEINLREHDIANMGFAEAVDCPVIIVADIDRGGVFAHLVGTLALLSESEQARVKGFVINRFRGDITILKPGLDWLEARTGKPVLGVLPYLHGLHLDAEDAIARDKESSGIEQTGPATKLNVIVPVLPRISNHTDFDPLRLHPDVNFRFIGPKEAIPGSDLIILPGSKAVRSDLAWLKSSGWHRHINRHLRYGGKLLGVCGGFQMLGQAVIDDKGLEGEPGSSDGLGLLQCSTHLEAEKILTSRSGRLALDGALFNEASVAHDSLTGAKVRGYEIHMGRTQGKDCKRPVVLFDDGRQDGAMNAEGTVAGSYLHGLFDDPQSLQAWIHWAGLNTEKTVDLDAIRELQLERLADTWDACVDKQTILSLLR